MANTMLSATQNPDKTQGSDVYFWDINDRLLFGFLGRKPADFLFKIIA